MNILSALGATIIAQFEALGGYLLFVGKSGAAGFLPPYRVRMLLKQMHFVGVESLTIVVITSVFTGMVFAIQAEIGFSQFGANGLIGGIVALSLTRELSPVLTALMVNGRVGSAMAAELGTMRVTEQVDALESTGSDLNIQYQTTLSGLQDLDMVKAISLYTQQQQTLQAAQMSFKTMSGLSLFNYIS